MISIVFFVNLSKIKVGEGKSPNCLSQGMDFPFQPTLFLDLGMGLLNTSPFNTLCDRIISTIRLNLALV